MEFYIYIQVSFFFFTNKFFLDMDIVQMNIQLVYGLFWLLPRCSLKETKLYLFNDPKL
jgi:hypothetical protein